MSKFTLASEFPAQDEAAWMAFVEKALRGADFEDTLVSRTADGLRIKPLYTPRDAPPPSGAPGEPPFLRGLRVPSRAQPWSIRQRYTEPDPSAVNAAILEDLEGGVMSIALQIAAPGQSGIEIDRFEDFARVFDGVRIDFAPIAVAPGEKIQSLMEMLHEAVSRYDHDAASFNGSLDADPLGTLARAGAASVNLETLFGQLRETVLLATREHPGMSTVLVDARPYHDGGASEVQELACLCATMAANLRLLEGKDLTPATVISQMAFALSCDTDQFLSIAKMRAARLLVHRIAAECGAPEALREARLHAETSQRMLSKSDPWVNLLRTTMACAAAVVGGTDSITVLPYTWALGLPDAFARRMARNIQIMLQEESFLGAVVDPSGGSFYVENLSRELATHAWALFQEIEKRGGMAECLAAGFIQGIIAEMADARAQAVATAELELTGVNTFPDVSETPVSVEPRALPPELDDPAITVERIPQRRPAEPFDRLRAATNNYVKRKGNRPEVFLVKLGDPAALATKVAYARNFFGSGGLEVTEYGPLTNAEESVAAFREADARLACLCTADVGLETVAVETVSAIAAAGASQVYFVGRPGDERPGLRAAGISRFIHRGCDMVEILSEAHDHLGIDPAWRA